MTFLNQALFESGWKFGEPQLAFAAFTFQRQLLPLELSDLLPDGGLILKERQPFIQALRQAGITQLHRQIGCALFQLNCIVEAPGLRICSSQRSKNRWLLLRSQLNRVFSKEQSSIAIPKRGVT